MRITLPYLHSVGVALFPPDPHSVQVSLCDIRTEGRVQGAPEGRTTTTGEVVRGGGWGGIVVRLGEIGEGREGNLFRAVLQLHPCSLDRARGEKWAC